jgi:metallophosphoesterase superfamily enzyme
MSDRTVVVISDTQIPYHDKRALKGVLRFIAEYQPDEVVQIGDLMDYPQPSRWNKGSASEFEGSVFSDSEIAKKQFLSPLRDAFDGPVKVLEGNHDLRPRHYLSKYAPALAESGAFNLDVLLDFEGFGVEMLPDFYEIAPDWIITHGHVGGIGLRQVAGSTALGGAKKFMKNLIMGHTHRLGMVSHTFGYAGQITKQVTGVEVGNLMDMKGAQYLKGGTGNWQQGFALLHINGRELTPTLVPIVNRRFSVEGVQFTL